jgi:hypothetical protein
MILMKTFEYSEIKFSLCISASNGQSCWRRGDSNVGASLLFLQPALSFTSENVRLMRGEFPLKLHTFKRI